MFIIVFLALLALTNARIDPAKVVASVEMECFKYDPIDKQCQEEQCCKTTGDEQQCQENFGGVTYTKTVYNKQGGNWNNNGENYVCCGLTADGNKHCAPYDAWTSHEGRYRLCEDNPATVKQRLDDGMYRDVCCDSQYIGKCGQCGAFILWPFGNTKPNDKQDTTEELIKPSNGFYNGTDWSDKYYDPTRDTPLYPNGFMGAVLRSENQPPVCVFIPDASGRTILVNVEPEEPNNRLCVGDMTEDDAEKTNPGFQKTCDTTSVSTCVHDGTIRGEVTPNERASRGITFKIDCNSGCVEQSDTYLWFRVLFSKNSYQNPNPNTETGPDKDMTNAATNPEMFCEYVLRDYPFLSAYPSDLDEVVDVYEEAEEDATFSVFSGLVVALLFLVL